jgi:hypothetical protein
MSQFKSAAALVRSMQFKGLHGLLPNNAAAARFSTPQLRTPSGPHTPMSSSLSNRRLSTPNTAYHTPW